MKERVWLDIALTATAVCLALGLFLACIGAAAGIAQPQGQDTTQATSRTAPPKDHAPEQVFEGMVTCSRCRARHAPALQRPAAVCVRVCVHGGASFALVNGDSAYLLEGDAQALKRFAGERARLVGTLHGHSILVRSITADP